MKRLITIALLVLCASMTALHSANPDSLKVVADSAYAREDFAQAAKLYRQIARAGESAAVCYNLGNCYYRQDDLAKAILWYERASLLSPGDADIRFNLDLARSKTIDKVVPRHEFFFVGWWRAVVNWKSIDEWAWSSIAFFALCLLGLLVYIYGERMWMRKTGFTMAVVFLLLTVIGNLCAWSQMGRRNYRSGAIVMAPAAVVKSTPSLSGSDLFVLHEGTAVSIKDDTLGEWCEVTLADGKQGWIQRKQIEVI